MFSQRNNRIHCKLNTDEKSRYSSGISEFNPAEILLKKQYFDLGRHSILNVLFG